ncbi:hypothetical protein EVAR_38444_1 [Eumeta japonica]|uniref:Uncharacterized protein n=1 Tax=Eumeta variegata TaxID=151549 RepID=A0A4C1X0K3_EUMVA|nr:hypothetical protein EVAR_38444_1 [Eumeta japonica]
MQYTPRCSELSIRHAAFESPQHNTKPISVHFCKHRLVKIDRTYIKIQTRGIINVRLNKPAWGNSITKQNYKRKHNLSSSPRAGELCGTIKRWKEANFSPNHLRAIEHLDFKPSRWPRPSRGLETTAAANAITTPSQITSSALAAHQCSGKLQHPTAPPASSQLAPLADLWTSLII